MSESGYKIEYGLLCVGKGGISGYYQGRSGCSCSIPDTRIAAYFGELIEGGIVIDKRPALDGPDAISISFNGPMIDMSLKPGESIGCPVPDPVMTSGLEGTFQLLASIKTASPSWRGLDHVDIATYAEYWRSHGAIIGVRVGDEVRFEDGHVFAIPPASARWNVDNDSHMKEKRNDQ